MATRKRNRGVNALLSDITNTCSPDTPTLKRACADQALQKIKEQAVRIGAPRGFHSACNIQQQQHLNQHLRTF